jgi:hypothetical protein
MKNLLISIFMVSIFLGLGFFTACTQFKEGAPGPVGPRDKQTRLALGESKSTVSTTGDLTDAQYDLLRFARKNYESINKIIFTSYMKSSTESDSCMVILVNKSDANKSIDTLATNSTTFVWKEKDITTKFTNTDAEINLGIKVISKKGAEVVGGQSYLFLYRD